MPRDQWLAAGKVTHIAVLVSYLCGCFLSVKKCDRRPTALLKYLGISYDAVALVFRVPQEKVDKVHERLQSALAAQSISFPSLQSAAGQRMSMSVAIRPV